MVQWLRRYASNAGNPGSIPGQGTRSHMHAATKSPHATTKIPCAAAKTRHRQINKYIYIYIFNSVNALKSIHTYT